jgi:glutamate-1-semialdehyde 2,1-aminomutase
MNVGATTMQENKLASELCSRFHLERVRFANSGTEANIHALSAARLFTGRRKVVAFGGAYHGGVLGFAGGRPAANNVDLDDWIIARYNDLDSTKEALQCAGVAAVILEGMQGAGGCFPATEDFLRGVQRTAKEVSTISGPSIGSRLINLCLPRPASFSSWTKS